MRNVQFHQNKCTRFPANTHRTEIRMLRFWKESGERERERDGGKRKGRKSNFKFDEVISRWSFPHRLHYHFIPLAWACRYRSYQYHSGECEFTNCVVGHLAQPTSGKCVIVSGSLNILHAITLLLFDIFRFAMATATRANAKDARRFGKTVHLPHFPHPLFTTWMLRKPIYSFCRWPARIPTAFFAIILIIVIIRYHSHNYATRLPPRPYQRSVRCMVCRNEIVWI